MACNPVANQIAAINGQEDLENGNSIHFWPLASSGGGDTSSEVATRAQKFKKMSIISSKWRVFGQLYSNIVLQRCLYSVLMSRVQ